MSHTPEKILENENVKQSVQINGFCNIMATRNKEEIEYEEDDRYSQLSKEQKELIDFIQSFQNENNDRNSNKNTKIKSFCSADPINEFEPTDELLTSQFPCIFPL